jgi:hypothetical protein
MSKFIDCNGKEITLGCKVVGVKSGVVGKVVKLMGELRWRYPYDATSWEPKYLVKINADYASGVHGVYAPENLEVVNEG